MRKIDIYFSDAVETALCTLDSFHGIEPAIENLMDSPSPNQLIMEGLETPYLSGYNPGTSVKVRIWIRFSHSKLWNEDILYSIKSRLNRQVLGDGVKIIVKPIFYTT